MKKLSIFALILALMCMCCACTAAAEVQPTRIELSDEAILVDGAAITGDDTAAVYAANDIVFYLAGQGFTYGEGTDADEHTQEEADAHTVVHITQPGTYAVSGKLSAGQIAIDLGKDAEEDPEAVVTLILDGVDISCSVAPAVIFYNVYECGEKDEETATYAVDTSAAGANVVIADGTDNIVSGAYVARIYKSVELNEAGTEILSSKKLHKYDAAFYSKMSMNVTGGEKGDGVLNIHAANEGLDSELHLTLNGGVVNIVSGNDGINTNEDNISVTTVNGGVLHIIVDGATGEGDGIDSNGWLVINGGTVTAAGCGFSGDAGIDSDKGIYINGGSVQATGNMFDHIAGGDATYAVFSFSGRQAGGSAYQLRNEQGIVMHEWTPVNDFTYLVVSSDTLAPGRYTLWQGETQLGHSGTGMGMTGHGGMGFGGQMPEGMQNFDPSQMQMPEGMQDFAPSQMQRPEGMPEMPQGDASFGGRGGSEAGQVPEGEMPQAPEGFDPGNMQRSGDMNKDGFGRSFGGQGTQGAQMDAFEIAEGANTFSGVAAFAVAAEPVLEGLVSM